MRLTFPAFALVMLSACQSQKIDPASLAAAPQKRPASAYRDSIHYSREVVDPLVRNGDCYERFEISLPAEIRTVVLPAGSTTFTVSGRMIDGYLRKSLSWAGHPAEPGISIDSERRVMGIAIDQSSRKLHIAAFGGWRSFEGGSSVKLAVGVPEGVRVEFSRTPSGDIKAVKLTADGWFVVDTEPATRREFTARCRLE